MTVYIEVIEVMGTVYHAALEVIEVVSAVAVR